MNSLIFSLFLFAYPEVCAKQNMEWVCDRVEKQCITVKEEKYDPKQKKIVYKSKEYCWEECVLAHCSKKRS